MHTSPNNLPPDPTTLHLPFDQYGRYAMIREALAAATPPDTTLRVLDVGGYSARRRGGALLLAQCFLPQHDVTVLDRPACDLPGYVQGDGRTLDFADASFDVVISCDTLEHIPAPDRPAFWRELLRVARCGVLLTAPFDLPAVVAAEAALVSYIRGLTGSEQPQLAEHRTFGLPNLDTTRTLLGELGAASAVFPAGEVSAWLTMMLLKHHLLIDGYGLVLEEALDDHYVHTVGPHDRRAPAYRQLVLAAPAAQHAWLAAASAALQPTIQPDAPPGWLDLAAWTPQFLQAHAARHAPPPAPAPASAASNDVTDDGERVTHLEPTSAYYAHLSLYQFARGFCQGARVLDAGSGTGYGAAYLAEQGAQAVWGVDISAQAVAFSRAHFDRPNLHFLALDVQQLDAFAPQSFDLIFCSNTAEHLPAVGAFLAHAARLLTPDGVLILAVPPITSDRLRGLNLDNPYHLNIWTPQQWQHTLAAWFGQVEHYGHGFDRLGQTPDWTQPAAQAGIRAERFVVAPLPLEALPYTPADRGEPTITCVFMARQPRPDAHPPQPPIIDHSFTRSTEEAAVQGRVKQQVRQLTDALAQHATHLAGLDALYQQQQAYSAHLEAAVQAKDAHIAHLETHIRQLANGRVLRLLRRFGW